MPDSVAVDPTSGWSEEDWAAALERQFAGVASEQAPLEQDEFDLPTDDPSGDAHQRGRGALDEAVPRFERAPVDRGPEERVAPPAPVQRPAFDVRRAVQDETSPVSPEDVAWYPLRGDRRYGMALDTAEHDPNRDDLMAFSDAANDQSLRTVLEEHTRPDGTTVRTPTTALWAATTDGNWTRPVQLVLDGEGDEFLVPRKDGTRARVSPERMAELIVDSPMFTVLTRGPVRPPLHVLTNDPQSDAATVSESNERLLAKLAELTGPWQGFHYTGPVKYEWDPLLIVPKGAKFTEFSQLTVNDLERESAGPVFAFSQSVMDRDIWGRFGREVRRGTAKLRDLLVAPGKRLVVVAADTPDGTFARVVTKNGVVHEVSGGRLAKLALTDPSFRAELAGDDWELALVAKESGKRVNFDGFGFDFAGELHAQDLFGEVVAPTGDAGTDGTRIELAADSVLEPVSGLRAGDLDVEVLRNEAGDGVAFYVREPGEGRESPRYLATKRWALKVTADTVSSYKVENADGGRVTVDSPWPVGTRPMFVFASGSGSGYLVSRRDGASEWITPEQLARLLRADPRFREILGRDANDHDLVLASQSGPVVGAKAVAAGLLDGGIARYVHVPRNGIRLDDTGGFTVDGAELTTVRPEVTADHVLTRALANGESGTYGQAYPRDAEDLYAVPMAAGKTNPVQDQYYLRELPPGSAKRYGVYLAPSAGHAGPVWTIDGHGAATFFVVAMKNADRPLQVGDALEVGGEDMTRLIVTSSLFGLVKGKTGLRVVHQGCEVNKPLDGSRPNAAEQLKYAWSKFLPSAPTTDASTTKFGVFPQTGVRIAQQGGVLQEVSPESGGQPPMVPLADLAAGKIDQVEAEFAHKQESLVDAEAEKVREVARRVARAYAWRALNGAGLPKVTITGYGTAGMFRSGVRTGATRAGAVAAEFRVEMAAEFARLARLGLDVRPADVKIDILGESVPPDGSRSATISVTLPEHDLGERELAVVETGDVREIPIAALNRVFAKLAPGWSPLAPTGGTPTGQAARNPVADDRMADVRSDEEPDDGGESSAAGARKRPLPEAGGNDPAGKRRRDLAGLAVDPGLPGPAGAAVTEVEPTASAKRPGDWFGRIYAAPGEELDLGLGYSLRIEKVNGLLRVAPDGSGVLDFWNRPDVQMKVRKLHWRLFQRMVRGHQLLDLQISVKSHSNSWRTREMLDALTGCRDRFEQALRELMPLVADAVKFTYLEGRSSSRYRDTVEVGLKVLTTRPMPLASYGTRRQLAARFLPKKLVLSEANMDQLRLLAGQVDDSVPGGLGKRLNIWVVSGSETLLPAYRKAVMENVLPSVLSADLIKRKCRVGGHSQINILAGVVFDVEPLDGEAGSSTAKVPLVDVDVDGLDEASRAAALLDVVKTCTVLDESDGSLLHVSGEHVEAGGLFRAHVWAAKLRDLGVPVKKLFVAVNGDEMFFDTPFAFGATVDRPGRVRFTQRAALLVQVKSVGDSVPVQLVLDPAVSPDRVLTLDEWLDALHVPRRAGDTDWLPIEPLPAEFEGELADGEVRLAAFDPATLGPPWHRGFFPGSFEETSEFVGGGDELVHGEREAALRRAFRAWQEGLNPAAQPLFNGWDASASALDRLRFQDYFRGLDESGRNRLADSLASGDASELRRPLAESVLAARRGLNGDEDRRSDAERLLGELVIAPQELLLAVSFDDLRVLAMFWLQRHGDMLAKDLLAQLAAELGIGGLPVGMELDPPAPDEVVYQELLRERIAQATAAVESVLEDERLRELAKSQEALARLKVAEHREVQTRFELRLEEIWAQQAAALTQDIAALVPDMDAVPGLAEVLQAEEEANTAAFDRLRWAQLLSAKVSFQKILLDDSESNPLEEQEKTPLRGLIEQAEAELVEASRTACERVRSRRLDVTRSALVLHRAQRSLDMLGGTEPDALGLRSAAESADQEFESRLSLLAAKYELLLAGRLAELLPDEDSKSSVGQAKSAQAGVTRAAFDRVLLEQQKLHMAAIRQRLWPSGGRTVAERNPAELPAEVGESSAAGGRTRSKAAGPVLDAELFPLVDPPLGWSTRLYGQDDTSSVLQWRSNSLPTSKPAGLWRVTSIADGSGGPDFSTDPVLRKRAIELQRLLLEREAAGHQLLDVRIFYVAQFKNRPNALYESDLDTCVDRLETALSGLMPLVGNRVAFTRATVTGGSAGSAAVGFEAIMTKPVSLAHYGTLTSLAKSFIPYKPVFSKAQMDQLRSFAVGMAARLANADLGGPRKKLRIHVIGPSETFARTAVQGIQDEVLPVFLAAGLGMDKLIVKGSARASRARGALFDIISPDEVGETGGAAGPSTAPAVDVDQPMPHVEAPGEPDDDAPGEVGRSSTTGGPATGAPPIASALPDNWSTRLKSVKGREIKHLGWEGSVPTVDLGGWRVPSLFDGSGGPDFSTDPGLRAQAEALARHLRERDAAGHQLLDVRIHAAFKLRREPGRKSLLETDLTQCCQLFEEALSSLLPSVGQRLSFTHLSGSREQFATGRAAIGFEVFETPREPLAYYKTLEHLAKGFVPHKSFLSAADMDQVRSFADGVREKLAKPVPGAPRRKLAIHVVAPSSDGLVERQREIRSRVLPKVFDADFINEHCLPIGGTVKAGAPAGVLFDLVLVDAAGSSTATTPDADGQMPDVDASGSDVAAFRALVDERVAWTRAKAELAVGDERQNDLADDYENLELLLADELDNVQTQFEARLTEIREQQAAALDRETSAMAPDRDAVPGLAEVLRAQETVTAQAFDRVWEARRDAAKVMFQRLLLDDAESDPMGVQEKTALAVLIEQARAEQVTASELAFERLRLRQAELTRAMLVSQRAEWSLDLLAATDPVLAAELRGVIEAAGQESEAMVRALAFDHQQQLAARLAEFVRVEDLGSQASDEQIDEHLAAVERVVDEQRTLHGAAIRHNVTREHVNAPSVPGEPGSSVDGSFAPHVPVVPGLSGVMPVPVVPSGDAHQWGRGALDVAVPRLRERVRVVPRFDPVPVEGGPEEFVARPRPGQRSAFDVRRAVQDGVPTTEVTVVVEIDGGGVHDERVRASVLRVAQEGVDRYLNAANLELPNGDVVRFRLVAAVEGGRPAHHQVRLLPTGAGLDAAAVALIDQTTWHPDQPPEFGAHEFAHMIGLVDEFGPDAGLSVEGSLMGKLYDVDEDGSYAPRPLRVPDRYGQVLAQFIGDDVPQARDVGGETVVQELLTVPFGPATGPVPGSVAGAIRWAAGAVVDTAVRFADRSRPTITVTAHPDGDGELDRVAAKARAERMRTEFLAALPGEVDVRVVVGAPIIDEGDPCRGTVLFSLEMHPLDWVSPDEVAWHSLVGADDRMFGLAPNTGERDRRNLAVHARTANDQSLRTVMEEATKSDGETVRTPMIALWAAMTDGNRTRPVELILDGVDDDFLVPLIDGSKARVTPEQMAQLLVYSADFALLTGGPVRPPLLLLNNHNHADPAKVSKANERLLTTLGELTGPWQGFHYAGPVKHENSRVLVVPKGARFTEFSQLTATDLQQESSDSVFAFSASARDRGTWRRFADSVKSGAARVRGLSVVPGKRLVVVAADTPDGTVARVVTKSGVVHEVGGDRLVKIALTDPVFRAAVDGGDWALALIAKDSGKRVNFDGFGFDFAGGLHAAKLFGEVSAPTGDVGTDGTEIVLAHDSVFESVSVLRAGDLDVEVLPNAAGEAVAVWVHEPGDDESDRYRAVTEWARDATAAALFVFAAVDGTGYSGRRSDGVAQWFTPGQLGRVLRADMRVRKILGSRARPRDFVFAPMGGEVAGSEDIAAALLDGGISRRMRVLRSGIRLNADGGFTVDGADLVSVALPEVTADHVLTRALATGEMGTYGQGFPCDPMDLYHMPYAASKTNAVQEKYYLRGEPAGSAKRFVAYLAPSAGHDGPTWAIHGHAAPGYFIFALKNADRPLDVGDVVAVYGEDMARLITTSALFEKVKGKPGLRIVHLGCQVNQPLGRSRRNAGEQLKDAWPKFLPTSLTTEAATSKVSTTLRTGVRILDPGGEFRVVEPESGEQPPMVPLGDLAASRIGQVEVKFAHKSKALAKADIKRVDAAAQKLARAHVWRVLNGAEPPEVKITGRGTTTVRRNGEKTGAARAQAVADLLRRRVNAEITQLEKLLGQRVGPARPKIDVVGEGARAFDSRSATITFTLPEHDLGERELEVVEGGKDLPGPITALNRAFAKLAPGWSPPGPAGGSPAAPELDIEADYLALASETDAERPPKRGADELHVEPKRARTGSLGDLEPGEYTSGGVVFSENPAELWPRRQSYDSMLPRAGEGEREAFYVFVTVRGDGFDLDGEQVSSAEFAERLRARDAYLRVAGESAVPLAVVYDVHPDGADEVDEVLQQFADAVLAVDPGREVLAVERGWLEQLPVAAFLRLSPIELDEVDWMRLRDATGKTYGLGLPIERDLKTAWGTVAGMSTGYARRIIEEKDLDGLPVDDEDVPDDGVETMAPWAAAVQDGRVEPLLLMLGAESGRHLLMLKSGRIVAVRAQRLAKLVHAMDVFDAASEADIQPSLAVATANLDPEVDEDYTPRVVDPNVALLAQLKTKPWHSYSYYGRVAFGGNGHLRISPGTTFTEHPLMPSDVEYVVAGSVFGFVAGSDIAAEVAEAIADGAINLDSWGAFGEPIIVFLDGAERHATLWLTGGGKVEADGRQFTELLFTLPEFRALLAAKPNRPLVFMSRDSAARKNIGGFAFDSAGVLRARNHFSEVFGLAEGTRPEPGMLVNSATFELVSTWRAGDLRMVILSNPQFDIMFFVLRSPGDEQFIEDLKTWLAGATPKTISEYRDSGGQQRKSNWDDDNPPVFIVGRTTPDGRFWGIRRDGKPAVLTVLDVSHVMRDDLVLREVMGRNGKIPLALAGIGGAVRDLKVFAEGMFLGGYVRVMYMPNGRLAFGKPGVLHVENGFAEIGGIVPEPHRILTYPHVRLNGELHGQFYPSEDFDAESDAVNGLHYDGAMQRTYFTEKLVTVPGPVGTEQQKQEYVEVDADWADEDVWLVDGHGEPPYGLVFAVLTGRPDVPGDKVRLVGEPAARAFYGSAFYAAGGNKNKVLLRHCQGDMPILSRPDKASPLLTVKRAWPDELGPVTMWGATDDVLMRPSGWTSVVGGGRFREIRTPEPGDEPPGTEPEAATVARDPNGDPAARKGKRTRDDDAGGTKKQRRRLVPDLSHEAIVRPGKRRADEDAIGAGPVKRQRGTHATEVPAEFAEARGWELIAYDETHGRWEARGADGEPSAVWHSAMNMVALYAASPPPGRHVTDEHGVLHADLPVLEWYEVPMALAAPPIAYTLYRPTSHSALGTAASTPPVDPATVAMPDALTAHVLPYALWRQDNDVLYHFSNRSPDQVVQDGGLLPKGTGTHRGLLDYIYNGHQDTSFVSTSRDPGMMSKLRDKNPGTHFGPGSYRYLYVIEAPGGIDANATLDIASPFPDQEEITFPGGVRLRYVTGYLHLVQDRPTGHIIPLPEDDKGN
ncbi:scabin-related ADP-ribosyltransferase [Actinokineospora alba]|uniref:scabin-related ADP-ribosyltransferase n=1 Tax=Actinokineospora alba TaxID=504798 RepID=UPI00116000F1|nr:hypothetical protein [Actinokineospora alba]